MPRVVEDHVGPPLPRPIGTLAARHKPFHRFALREHLPTRDLDELDASMGTEREYGAENFNDRGGWAGARACV